MKRSAENQLTRDDIEEGHVEPEQTPETGFKKASDETLKTRIIRGLPNRTKPSGAQLNSTNGTTAPPLFPPSVASPGSTTFAFTSPAAAATNSFASPVAPSDSINSSPNPFGVLSQTSSSPTTSTTPFAFPSSSDKLTSSAPSTVKAFASVLNNSESNVFGSPTTNPSSSSFSSNQPSAVAAAAAADGDDSVLFKYYINLRGLNHSLINAISKGIEDDPFADMSGILESYKSMRQRIQKEKDDAAVPSKPESTSNSSPPTPSSSFFSMPAAVSPFGKQSPFSTPGLTSTPSTTSTSIFSSPSASVQPNPFAFSAPKTSNETPTPSVFGAPSPLFKTSSTITASAFGGPASSSPFKFGGSSQASPSIFGSSKPTSTFKWGASADQPATGGASDNSTRSSPTPATNSAVHFQFGSGSSGIAQSPLKTVVSAEETTTDAAADGEGSEQVTPTTEKGGESSGSVSNMLAVHNPHDDEGEGEENEISVHAIKVKAYRMRKADEKGGPGWADLGFGILRLKKDKNTTARRMLLRNSTNGKILINFKIYSGLKPSLAKKALTFVGHDNGVSQTYCVRLPGEEQAEQLKDVLDQEVESVTAKDKE